MHEVLVNRLGGLSLPRLTDHPNMTLDIYPGRKTTIQQLHHHCYLRCTGTPPHFCAILRREKTCGFLFSSLDDKALPKKGSTHYLEKNKLLVEKIFLYELAPRRVIVFL